MTAVATPAGAVSHNAVDWHAINWQKAHTIVRRLQARIVKATQAGRWGKVRALQRLLTHSFSAKVLAVKRVTENQGKRTPGVDGVIWETPEKKAQAVSTLRQHGYRTQPLRRVYIAKSGGTRETSTLDSVYDRSGDAGAVPAGPRSHRGNPGGPELVWLSPGTIHGRCHRSVSSGAVTEAWSAQWILEGDIRSCFDSFSHDWLMAHIPMDKAILRKWLKAGFMDKHVLYPTEAGVPQGGMVSPVLMNLALNGLERHIKEAFPRFQGHMRTKVHVIRFADDFIITGTLQGLLGTGSPTPCRAVSGGTGPGTLS